jgi:peptidoglycan/LPS O-acetylase OafA/YrhL
MPRRVDSLNGLRGISALMIVLFHVRWTNHFTELHFFREAYLFVDVFFILSGFVLTKTYGDRIHTARDASGFLILRFFRIYPLHIAALLAFVLYELTKIPMSHFGLDAHPFRDSPFAFLSSLLLVQSFTFSDHLTWNVPSWSISSEAVAYVLFAGAATVGWLARREFVHCAIIVALGSYIMVLRYKGSLFAVTDLAVLRCLGGFLIGAVVAKAPDAVLARLSNTTLGAIAVVLIGAATAVLSLFSGYWEILAIPVFALLIFVLQLDKGFPARMLKSTPCMLMGQISYSMYMVHWFVLTLVGIILSRTVGDKAINYGQHLHYAYRIDPYLGDLGVACFVALIIFIATITYRFVEAPWRSFGRSLVSRDEAVTPAHYPASRAF